MFSANASQVSATTLAVEECFAAYTRTGTGASATVTTGIDLSTHGGLVASKGRTDATNWAWYDTARGATYDLVSNSAAAQSTQAQGLTSFGATGHTWGTLAKVNTSAATYVDFVFRKAAKFFDVVTYTGTGVARNITHSLGQAPGMVIIKDTGSANNWRVWHRSAANAANPQYALMLNLTNAETNTGADIFGSGGVVSMNSSTFSVGTNGDVNVNGGTYVAYLFAHDSTASGIIQCGSFTTDGSGNGSVDHGKTQGIQFAMLKCSGTTGDWETYDTARTSGFTGNDARLRPNLSNAEDSVARVSSSGTTLSFIGLSASQTYIYVFITARIV